MAGRLGKRRGLGRWRGYAEFARVCGGWLMVGSWGKCRGLTGCSYAEFARVCGGWVVAGRLGKRRRLTRERLSGACEGLRRWALAGRLGKRRGLAGKRLRRLASGGEIRQTPGVNGGAAARSMRGVAAVGQNAGDQPGGGGGLRRRPPVGGGVGLSRPDPP